MSQHCRVALIPGFQKALQDETTRERLRALILPEDLTPESILSVLTDAFPLDLRLEAQREIATLPDDFLQVLLAVWKVADRQGESFTLDSPPPAQPIAAAKKNLVSYRIDRDDDGVRFDIMHVEGHHPRHRKQQADLASV